MDSFSELVNLISSWVGSFVWGPFMLAVFLGTGIFFSVKTKLKPVLKCPSVIRQTLIRVKRGSDKTEKGNISSYGAMSAALAGTMGIGNIAGVSTAILLGGPGAVFWMSFCAFFGMMTKYAEVTLSIHFRQTDREGRYFGGPMYYMEKSLNSRGLGVIFSLLCLFASFGIGNTAQSNTAAAVMKKTFGIDPFITGFIFSLVCGLVILGGVRRIVRFSENAVPLMGGLYLLAAFAVLIINREHLVDSIRLVLTSAFSIKSSISGIEGYQILKSMRYGIARGVFSNEAGLGSSPILHAAANTEHPVKQGMWGVFEVFADTIVMCNITALTILSSEIWREGITGAELTEAVFVKALGPLGGYIIAISILFFAFSSIIGWSYYGEMSLKFLTKSNTSIFLYRVVFIVLITIGAVSELNTIWEISDILNGLMAIPNLISILALSPMVFHLTNQFFNSKR